jgi:hypothetical protein
MDDGKFLHTDDTIVTCYASLHALLSWRYDAGVEVPF